MRKNLCLFLMVSGVLNWIFWVNPLFADSALTGQETAIVNFEQSRLFFAKKDYTAALKFCKSAFHLCPKNLRYKNLLERIYYNLAQEQLKTHKMVQARQYYKEGLKVEKESTLHIWGLANVNIIEKKYAEAFGLLNRIENKFIENPVYLKTCGNLCFKLKLYEKARSFFEYLLKVKPYDAYAHFALGKVAYQRGKLAEAHALLFKALRLTPENRYFRKLFTRVEKEQAISGLFKSFESQNFIIAFSTDFNSEQVEKILALCEKSLYDISSILGVISPEKINVVFYSNAQFRKLQNGFEYAAGMYDGKIRIPLPEAKKLPENLEVILRHELTHLMISLLCGKRCPVWLNEGIAQVLEVVDERQKKEFKKPLKMLVSKTAITILESLGKSKEPELLKAAYYLSRFVTSYLVQRSGKNL
ncbi:tetratricopeptide repeat protein, partial [Candidatus Riflebacteria bacterium]